MSNTVVTKVHLTLEGDLKGGFLRQAFAEDIREGNWEISLHGIILIYQDLDVDVAVGVYSNLTGEPASSDEAFGNRTSSPALGFDILPESRHAGEPTYHIMNIGGAGYPIIDATNFVQITIRDLLTGTPMKFKQPPYCAVIVNLTQKGIP